MAQISRREFLQRRAVTGMAAPLVGSFGLCGPGGKPLNFVFILMDDMGWSDLGCQGSTFYENRTSTGLRSRGPVHIGLRGLLRVLTHPRQYHDRKHPARSTSRTGFPGRTRLGLG